MALPARRDKSLAKTETIKRYIHIGLTFVQLLFQKQLVNARHAPEEFRYRRCLEMEANLHYIYFPKIAQKLPKFPSFCPILVLCNILKQPNKLPRQEQRIHGQPTS